MLDSEDDVDRTGRGRQRSDHRADERSAALDHDRGDNDDRGGHCHLERQLQQKRQLSRKTDAHAATSIRVSGLGKIRQIVISITSKA
jgi:hypothetical protein